MKILDYLLKNGESKSAFCKRAGITRNTLDHIINEKKQPNYMTIYKIEKATNGKVSSKDLGLLK